MSWLDQVNNEFIIITGDATEYKPNWLNATRSVEFNVSEYEFPEVSGTLVSRRKPKGVKYNLEIYFQGDDHLEVAEKFRISANDSRAWTIIHPFYGALIVQPLSLNFDNTKYNVSEIKGTIIETITDDNPKITVDPTDKITQDKADVDDVFAESFSVEVPAIDAETSVVLTKNIIDFYNEGKLSVLNTLDAEVYFNLFNVANSAVLNITSPPLATIRAIQALASYPALLANSVDNRIKTLVNQFNKLANSVGLGLLTSPSTKKSYENNAAGVLSSMCLAAVTNAQYDNADDVLAIIGDLTDSYDQYLLDLDALQTTTGGDPDSFMADASSLIGLNNLINFTVSNLFDIALNSKKERSILCEEDTNVIMLAHRFYGLKDDDSTIDKIIANNKIGLYDLFQIRKGQKIVYYV